MQILHYKGIKRLKIIFFSIFLLVLPFVSAQIIINEIMYDLDGSDTGREWIEIYNGMEDINLSGWKFYEAGTNHGLNLINGSEILKMGDFAVIADKPSSFLQNNPSFNGTLFDSAFSLSNSNETIALKNSSLDIVYNITYFSAWGASGNNYSLQFNDTDWCEGSPTPGKENICQSISQSESNQTQPEENQTAENETEQQDIPDYEYEIEGVPGIITDSNTDFTIKVIVKNNKNETKTFDIWSYIYRGSKCYSQDREANKKTITLSPGSSESAELENQLQAKEIQENNNNYKFKVKVLRTEIKTPKEFTYNLTINITISNPISEKSTQSEESDVTLSNQDKQLTTEEEFLNDNTLNQEYSSKSEKSKAIAPYIFAVAVVMIAIYIIRRKI